LLIFFVLLRFQLFAVFVEIARVIERSTTAPMVAFGACQDYLHCPARVGFMLLDSALSFAVGAAQ
jgi:hypothetical protein